MFSKEVIFLSPRTEGKQTGPLRSHQQEGEGEKRGGFKRWKTKLSSFIQPLSLYCDRTAELEKPYPLSLFSFHPPFSLFTVFLISGAKDDQFIFGKQVSEHQIFVATKKKRKKRNSPSILCQFACSRMRMFALCAHHERLDCVLREH